MKKFTMFFSVLGLALVVSSISSLAQRVTVSVVGTGIAGFNGDGIEGKNTILHGPKDVCLDAAGNLLFVDRGNGLVRKRDKLSSKISTIAGGGTSTAEYVSATSAAISPNYICIDVHGNIYISTDNQIRKIDAASGNILTVAGTGVAGFSGDGGPAIAAQINKPQGIAINAAGDLFIVDRNNNRIRMVSGTTGVISTIAGTGTMGYSGDGAAAVVAELKRPAVITVGPAGDVYFSDQSPNFPSYDNSIVRKIDMSTGVISTVLGSITPGPLTEDVPALEARLGTITGLCFGPHGCLYCNEMSCSCRMLDFASDSLFLVGGNFSIQSYSDDIRSPLANMNIPYGLCVDNASNVYVADSNNHRIRKIIALTTAPTFAYGDGLFMTTNPGDTYGIDSLLWATDLDMGQTEKWEVVRAPVHGMLSGLSTTAISVGDATTVKPTGVTYKAEAGYLGTDYFRVRVTDNETADTITIYTNAVEKDDDGGGATTGVAGTNMSPTDVSIYPNPATTALNIEWNSSSSADVMITDITNRVLYHNSFKGNAGVTKIDISSYPAGVYMIRLNGMEAKKFVKQ